MSGHPGYSPDGGEPWVASAINWIGKSAYWKNTAIFVIFDDWGGYYDHVTPPPTRADGLGPGLREPFLVISPYAIKPGRVIHTTADYASILRFAETRLGVKPVNSLDANAASIDSFFDFTKAPAPFVPLNVPGGFDPAKVCAAHPLVATPIDADP